MSGNNGQPGRSVMSKVLAILDSFTPQRPELGLTEICAITGLSAPTVHRLARELVGWGALERLPNGAYRVGLRLWEIGSLAPRPRSLRDLARPYMQDLYDVTRENVQLAVLDGFQVLYVEKIFGRRAVPVVSSVGGRLPLHATGVGKILLAFSPPSFQEQVIRRGLDRCTAHTIIMPGMLRRVLAEARRSGLAICAEEMSLGTVSVAAPVYDKPGSVVAALSLVMHSFPADTRRLAPAVRTAARGVSRELSRCPVDMKTGVVSAVS